MIVPDWRTPCEHGTYDSHPVPDGRIRVAFCPGGSPVTTADLEKLGDMFDWCVIHYAFASDHTGNCKVEKRLLLPIPDAELVGE